MLKYALLLVAVLVGLFGGALILAPHELYTLFDSQLRLMITILTGLAVITVALSTVVGIREFAFTSMFAWSALLMVYGVLSVVAVALTWAAPDWVNRFDLGTASSAFGGGLVFAAIVLLIKAREEHVLWQR